MGDLMIELMIEIGRFETWFARTRETFL